MKNFEPNEKEIDLTKPLKALTINLVLFILVVLALFLSNKAQAQPDSIYNLQMPMGSFGTYVRPQSTTLQNDGDAFPAITPYSTRIDPQQKKDTVEVQAACIEFIHVEAWEPSKASPVKWLQVLEVKTLVQERTLEWQTWDSNTTNYAIYRPKSNWVTTSTRWLSPIDGCYQLIPLTND